MSRSPLASAVPRALLLAALAAPLFPQTARPQEQPVAAAEETPVIETVTVTGTRSSSGSPRLSSPVESTTPPAGPSHGGLTTYLHALWQLFGQQDDAGSPVLTYARRDLDPSEALVQVDARPQPVPPAASADTNIAPPSLLERFDALTGSSTAPHGPDSVSGALSFIVNKHFDGIRISGAYGFYSHERRAVAHNVRASDRQPVATQTASAADLRRM